MGASRRVGLLCLGASVCLLLLALIVATLVPALRGTPDTVQQAWDNARATGAYSYHSQIEQTTVPLDVLANVGLSDTTEQLYLSGRVDLPRKALELRIWGQNGDVATGSGSVEIKVEHGKAFGRAGAGE